MKTAIILHGMPSEEEYIKDGRTAADKHWLPWLQNELTKAGVAAYAPEMPEPYAPDYQKWSAKFEQIPIDEHTALVGHSCGGGFLVRWLSEHPSVKVNKVVLVAPWIDPNHKFAPAMFNDLKIDPTLASRTAGLYEMISLDDDQEELDTLKILKESIKDLHVIEFADKGHFCFNDLKTNELPELRDLLLN